MIKDSGKLRVYVALGEILGWLIYYFSFGTIAMKISNAVIRFFRRIFGAVFKPIKRIYVWFSKKIIKSGAFGKKIIRKFDKKAKFNLQKYKGIVYNLNSYIKK